MQPFNVLRYQLGQHYDSHYDTFDPGEKKLNIIVLTVSKTLTRASFSQCHRKTTNK